MIVVIWCLVLVAALILYYKQTYSVFRKQGVKQFSPVPFLGDMARIIMRKEHFVDQMQRMYNAYPEERFVGRYEFIKPLVLVRDVELIKKITVKDFEYFLDHRVVIDENLDPLFGRNLFSLKGQEWKDMRSTLSPAFTSSKMKLMLPLILEVGEQMIAALMKKIADSGVNYIDIECKDLMTRYANDVIASCTFGLKVDSMTDVNNEFYVMGRTASTFNFKQMLKFFGFTTCPNIMKALNINLFSEDLTTFFSELVRNTMKEREARQIFRPDVINILMEAKKGKITHEENTDNADTGFATVEESVIGKKEINREWSDNDLASQAILFFIAGFETVSSAMSFLLHEIAVNPDVQNRLYEEIMENEVQNEGKFDYKSIQNMVYLDMVVSEVLRLWPPAIVLDRLCTKDYNMGKPNNKSEHDFILQKGTPLGVPVWAIHRDPNNFPNPIVFDPERFSEENKHKIKPLTYMPFGLGPRNCVGSRFALCEVKVMAYQLLQHMELSPCEKTCIPAKISKDTFNLRIENGHWLRMRVR